MHNLLATERASPRPNWKMNWVRFVFLTYIGKQKPPSHELVLAEISWVRRLDFQRML